MRFGVNLSTSTKAERHPVEAARQADALGFDLLSTSDHLHGTHPTYETWTLLAWVAANTERITLLTNVLGLPYRSPAVTAKMAETLHRLSDGRFVCGLGAGGNDEEFAAFGLAERSPGQKIEALTEALTIIRGLWAEEGYSFDGERYRVSGAELTPKPGGAIPIWLGSYGNRALALTGRLADGWIPSVPFAAPDRIPAMRERVLAAAKDAGRDPDEITCAYNVPVRVGGDPKRSERVVAGTADEIADRVASFVEMGMTVINFWAAGAGEAEQWERLATEVVPKVKELAG